ncbi:E3 ubiquitin-protein ligase Topors isoform X2 [Tribolium castaneum]|uniref:E3 ubiquitin-protein ligase Topors isoform X2 n=1 Tax=Tribolium castaneum TaxID=7070 RepID=UPI00046BFDA6|nr:PREDICTED: E3 ubiquitin-protein ligase Topors isoform X2 [Tribolium castaneum]|eukprot:XP_008195988.1 PREDICTED: E3 ubiquitin-protein ligase Topors isoform X2 [Tribolium castaneum]
MADSKLASPRADTASPPPHCAICLGTCKNKCRANSCMHEFCYSCLLEWSRIKAECPLCKQEFKSILHNIKSLNEYDVHIVENITVENNRYLENASLIYLPPATPPVHQYHFRYTNHRRRRGDTSTSFRRSVYTDNLWVYAPPDITGRYRDVSPSYYRHNPAARTRLVPWLNRELNALLYENTQQVMHLVDIIMDHLLRHHICSYMFRSLLYDYLGNKTDHFIHEFYNFMRSPFDMVGYDRHVIYTERQHSSPFRFVDEIDVSDYDSDVILVSDTNNNQGAQAQDPVIIDLVETDSDEPIIVSEERNETRWCDEELNRQPILPLKLRIKNRHKSKEKKSKSKKRHRPPSTSPSTSSSTSSSEDSSSDTDCGYKRYHKRCLKKIKREKKKRKDSYYVERNNSDNEDDIPLANFTKKKKAKHSKHKSYTVVNSKKEKKHSHKHHELGSEACDSTQNPTVEVESQNGESLKSEDKHTDSTNSDESFYSEHKPYVKSKIRDLRNEDRHKAGPSSGRLRNTLKKETSTNLWYSRPCLYDSDSSDS